MLSLILLSHYLANACEYNGIVYKKGETWTDGCKFNCTCEDAKTGYYSCTTLYVVHPI